MKKFIVAFEMNTLQRACISAETEEDAMKQLKEGQMDFMEEIDELGINMDSVEVVDIC